MSENAPAVAQAVSTASVANPGTDGAPGKGEEKVTSKTVIKNLADLAEKAPEVCHAMIQGIAMSICNDWQHFDNRLKAIQHEMRRH